ncbi:MAG: glycosyltransferase family 2 protein [Candidatus Omnitrophica bacterium]|nr:glycosyltransferase family 2 protein [Candidatus Omnitrophota bacterium]
MPPKISVIMPTYNCAATIAAALDSIFNQQYRDLEVIVVDDGSTDNTKDVLKAYGDRIRYFYKDNSGAVRSRLFGLRQASGEYIALLDADDLWMPDKLGLQALILDTCKDIDFLFADFQDFNAKEFSPKSCFDGSKVFRKIPARPVSPEHPYCKVFTRDIMYDYLQGNFILPSTLLMRKTTCVELGMFTDDPAIREQYEFSLRALHRLKMAFIDRVLVHRRFRGSNLTKNATLWHERTVVLCQKALPYPWLDQRCKNFLTTLMRQSYYKLGADQFKKGNVLEARKLLRQSLSKNFSQWRAKLLYLLTFFMPSRS